MNKTTKKIIAREGLEGNTNPHTGKIGTNHYRNNTSSEYYGTSNSSGLGSSNSSSSSLWDWQK